MPRGPVGTLKVIGMVSRRDLISAYHKRLHSIREHGLKESEGSNVFDQAAAVEAIIRNHSSHRAVKLPPATSAGQPGPELLEDPQEDQRR